MATPTRGVPSSHLATIARQRAAVQAARRSLSLGQDRGAPAAPNRAIPNMPPQRVPSGGGRPPAPAAGAPEGAEGQQERMRQKVQEFLSNQQRPNAQPIPEQGLDVQAPQPDTVPLSEQAARLGATGLSPEQQFYRLAGRLGSPREMAVFRTTVLLEGQLNRRPTANELRAALMRPATLGNAFPSVVEA